MNDGRLITIICLMLLSPVATVNVNAVATAGIYLLKDADRVRQLLETNSCMGCDLREVNLEDAKLKGSLVIGHWSLVIRLLPHLPHLPHCLKQFWTCLNRWIIIRDDAIWSGYCAIRKRCSA